LQVFRRIKNTWRTASQIDLPSNQSLSVLNLDDDGKVMVTDINNKNFKFYNPSAVSSSKYMLDYIEQKEIIESALVLNGGYKSAISHDGTTLAIGPTTFVSGGNMTFRIYTRTNFTWTLQATLTLPAIALASSSLSLNANGDVLAIGQALYDDELSNPGIVYVYRRTAGVWGTAQSIQHSDKVAQDQLGYDVSLSNDGNYLLATAANKDPAVGGVWSAGAAYVFYYNGASWVQQAKLIASPRNTSERFGYVGKISGDGATIAIGTGGETANRVYVFTRSNTTWTQRATLTQSDSGRSLALSNDGTTIAMCDVGNTGIGDNVYVYTGSGANWTLQKTIINPYGFVSALGGNGFAGNLVLSEDGNSLVIGSQYSDIDGQVNRGSIFFFRRINSTWYPQSRIVPPVGNDYDSGFFGTGLVMDGSGTHILASSVPSTGSKTIYYYKTILGPTYNNSTKKLTFVDIKENINTAMDNMTMSFNAIGDFDLVYKVTTPSNGISIRNQPIIKI
jgi:disulfide oxidoreductase YuzD